MFLLSDSLDANPNPAHSIFWRAIVLQNIFICVQQKKETHISLQKLKGE